MWRYSRQTVDSKLSTVVQYKHSMAKVETFEQSEWGPWKYVYEKRNNKDTGMVESVQVCMASKAACNFDVLVVVMFAIRIIFYLGVNTNRLLPPPLDGCQMLCR